MKLKDFKKYINNIDSKYDDCEVVEDLHARFKVESFYSYGDMIMFARNINNNNFHSYFQEGYYYSKFKI